jgi:hypothetical protein
VNYRFKNNEIPVLARAMDIPEKFSCPQGTICEGIEGVCILLRRFCYPCRYRDLIPLFTIYNLLKLRTSYRLFTKVKSNEVIMNSRYNLELIIRYVVRSGQSSIMLSSCPLPTICTNENGAALERIHNCIYSIITFELIEAIALYSVSQIG